MAELAFTFSGETFTLVDFTLTLVGLTFTLTVFGIMPLQSQDFQASSDTYPCICKLQPSVNYPFHFRYASR